MRYLLDTHALLWIVSEDPQLGPNAKDIYLNDENDIFISMASIWEMAIKINLQKLDIPGTLSEFIKEHVRDNKIDIMSIGLKHLYQIENLNLIHRDPFDRLIIAQAIAENIPVISKDYVFEKYPVQRVW